MRGKLGKNVNVNPRNRITPACAGKTTGAVIYICDGEDHPRVCGENRAGIMSLALVAGSPPRVRGKQAEEVFEERIKRITPACAGKTLLIPLRNPRSGDHPRVCGENARVLMVSASR